MNARYQPYPRWLKPAVSWPVIILSRPTNVNIPEVLETGLPASVRIKNNKSTTCYAIGPSIALGTEIETIVYCSDVRAGLVSCPIDVKFLELPESRNNPALALDSRQSVVSLSNAKPRLL